MTDPLDDLLARLAAPPTPEVPPDVLDQMRRASAEGQDLLLTQLFRNHTN